MLTLDSFSQITQSIENEPWPQRKQEILIHFGKCALLHK